MKRLFLSLLILLIASVSLAGAPPAPPATIVIIKQADCSAITSGACLDTDDGKLYVWDGDSVALATVAAGAVTIDDTKGNGDTTYAWSADKVFDQLALKLNATALDDTKGNGDTTYIWSADKVFDQLALHVTIESINTAAELETVANLGAYASDILGAATKAAAATLIGVGTGDSPQFTGIELSHASANTLSAAAGVLSIEGAALATAASVAAVKQTQTVTMTGDDTFTPTDAEIVDAKGTCSHGTVCTVTMADSGTAGNTVEFYNESAIPFDFPYSDTVLNHTCGTGSTVRVPQYAGITLKRLSDRWMIIGSYGATACFSAITTVDTFFIPISYANDTAATNPDAAEIVTGQSNGRKHLVRHFSNAADANVTINWLVPSDISATDGVKFRWVAIVSNADPPTDTDDEDITFGLQGISIGDNDSGDPAAFGNAQTSAFGATAAQDDIIFGAWSTAITTITNLAAGELVHFNFYRDVDGGDHPYDQEIGVIGIELKFKRNHNATF